MSIRRVLNVVLASLSEGLDDAGMKRLLGQLREPFDSELTAEQKRRRDYWREAERIGAIQGQDDLMAAFNLGQAPA